MRRAALLLVFALAAPAPARAQSSQGTTGKPGTTSAKPGTTSTSKPAARGAPPVKEPEPPPAPVTEPAMLTCPFVLGDGVQTKRTYCDVPIGMDPAMGIVIALPPHAGDVTLTFDLHNRHTYSAEQVKARKAFSRYTATVGVLTMKNFLLSRAVVLNEFRTEADLVDRISGGSGPGGLKAVAPTGLETITITIPEVNQSVSILGEKLSVIRLDAVDNFTTIGRPIAVISNVRVTYLPPPPPPPEPPPKAAPKPTSKPPAKSAPRGSSAKPAAGKSQ
jgi:hypothetical protein